jgi:hypothetical protein
MLTFLAHRPNLTPTYSVQDLVGVGVIATVMGGFVTVAGGALSLLAPIACAAVFLAFYLAGSLFAGWRPLAAGVPFDLPLRLLVGYAVVNTALFVLVWLSPLGVVVNFGIVLGIVAVLFLAARPVRSPPRTAGAGAEPARASRSEAWLDLAVVVLSLAAATLWCQDSIRPMAVQGDSLVVKPWIDGFYHAVHIRIFGESHGAASIEDFRLVGEPARLYHYGMYMVPAVIRQIAGLHSYTAFAAILAPMGVFFTGLGAYALVGAFWGRWPGLCASAALLLLPDGAQQGMRNPFMSYHWLTQISPSATYGLALLAIAWLFVLVGCRQGRKLQLLAGWLLGGILLAYKVHFFIASALLLLLLPPLFFRGSLGLFRRVLWERLLWAGVALGLFGVTLFLVQKVPGVPSIRLDGSGLGEILGLVKSFAQPGAVRDFLAERIGRGRPWFANVFLGGPFVLFAALGLLLPLLALLVIRHSRRTPPLFTLFPLLLVANFLAMFLGLALDFTRSTPDELSHRPVVVMYFVVAAWVGGGAGRWLCESRRLARVARPAIVGAAVLLLAVPAWFGAGVHRMWNMRMFSPVEVPLGLYRAAQYLRAHAGARDVTQVSRFDRVYAVAALSERRAYVSRTMTLMRHNQDKVEARVDAIDQWKELRDATAVVATAREKGIRWFLLEAGDRVAWPEEIAARPVFELDGWRLYRF